MFTRINLYKNCILTARNTEVFRDTTILEEYLETLDKPYSTDIDLANVYTTLSGTITIDATPLNGDFNYIKFEEFNDEGTEVKQTVYAFIDSFRIINDLLVISYSVDVWHTYFEKCTLRESLITKSLILRENEPYDLPLRFIGKSYPSIERLTAYDINENYILTDGYAIIIKAQFFDLTSGGEPSGIVDEEYLVYNFLKNYNTNNEATEINPLATLLDVSNICDRIQSWQNKNQWKYSTASVFHYARIVKTYIVPAKWLSNLNIFRTNINNRYLFVDLDIGSSTVIPFNQFKLERTIDYHLLHWLIKPPLKNLDEVFSFGFFTSQLPFEFDGINRAIILSLTATRDTLNFYLKFNNKIIEITDLFMFEQDYTPTTPDVLAQREIARKQQTIQGITGVINNLAQIGIGAITAAFGFSGGYGGNAAFENAMGWNLPSSSGGTLSQKTGGTGNIVGGITGLVDNISKISFANKEKYMTFSTSNNFSSAYINAYYDLCALCVNEIVNENEVLSAINETGYGVEYFANSIDISQNISTYNIMKFGFVRITGLSTEICEAIAKILTDGVKIWYTKNV